MNSSSSNLHRVFSPLSRLCLIWCEFAILDILLMVVVPKTMVYETQLPILIRISLVCYELFILAIGTTIIGFPLFITIFDRGNTFISKKWSWLIWILLNFTTWVFFFLFFASWLAFLSTNRFIDLSGLQFWYQNAIQFIQHIAHMMPFWLLALPFISLIAALGTNWLIPKLISRLNRKTTLSLTVVVGCVVMLFAAGAMFGKLGRKGQYKPFSDPKIGVIYTLGDLYATCREERTGPLSHFFGDLYYRVFGLPEVLEIDSDIDVIRRPIIDMNEYLAEINNDSLRYYNVIIIVVESLRADQLRACGSQKEIMPQIETLASEGCFFTNAYTQSSHSNYADPCLLSSHYPLRGQRTHVYPKNPTYPRVLIYDILKQVGYHTAVFSSQNENWGGMINYLQTGNIDHFLHAETFKGSTYVPRQDTGFAAFVSGSKRAGKIDDRFTVGEAIKWIEDLKSDPFFIYMNLQNSHVPYETPSDFPRRFGPAKIDFNIFFGYFPIDKVDVVKEVYANSLAYVDFQIGRLFKYLKDQGLWNKTIIIVTGDTGQAFFEHGFAAHASQLFDEVMRIPIIVYAPGMISTIDDRPCQHIDIPPTILDLLGLKAHPSFQGINLLDVKKPQDRSIYMVSQSPLAHQYAIVRSGHKLIYDYRSNRYILYNLQEDPCEKRDLSLSQPQLLDTLLRRLNTWRKLQIDYYRNIDQHTQWYPPILKD